MMEERMVKKERKKEERVDKQKADENWPWSETPNSCPLPTHHTPLPNAPSVYLVFF